MLRADAYRRAGIPLPSENRQIGRIIEFAASLSASRTERSSARRGRARLPRPVRDRLGRARGVRLSSVVIGRALGDRDHSTILNAQRRAEELRAEDEEYREITDRLLALVTPKKTQEEEAENAASSH
jgi:chromosomal replication initiation ATPase DnaA